MITVSSHAKVNLALHVTGKRQDGYHDLDSIVVFPDISDKLEFTRGEGISLETSGMFSEYLPEDNTENLVFQAASLLAENPAHQGDGIKISLQKLLPVSSGIGGGSGNAATTLNVLNRMWNLNLEPQELMKLAASLGSDVPVCLSTEPARIRDTGATVSKFASFPGGAIVLVNPNIPLPTSKVFAQLTSPDNPPLPSPPQKFDTLKDLADWLGHTRNDLQAPARKIAPRIGDVITKLNYQPGCLLSGMSGSGATCFGLFENTELAESACRGIRFENPDWWVQKGSF